MSDYGDYNDDIEYNPDEYDDVGGGSDLNLEDMYIEAENSDEIEKFKQVIELERDNSSTHHWSFKSYEKICLIFIKSKDIDNFTKNFEKLINLYSKVGDCYKIDTVRNINYTLNDLCDNDFSIAVLKFMYRHLIEQDIDREVLNTGLQLAKILFLLEKDEDLGKLLDSIFNFLRRLNTNDESTNSMKLEFIIINIQYLNKVNNVDECENLYFEAEKLNKEKIIRDNRINGIISEEAGKYLFRLEKYSEALENFKDAYKSYQDSGNPRTNIILKYIILCYIMQRNEETIIDTEESKKFPNDILLKYMVDLKEAYDKIDIKKINKILFENILNEETDFLIKDNQSDIIRNIRVNYLIKKLRIYKNISITTLEKDMQLNEEIIKCLVNQLCNIGSCDIKINYVRNCIELNNSKKDEMDNAALNGYNKWIKMLT